MKISSLSLVEQFVHYQKQINGRHINSFQRSLLRQYESYLREKKAFSMEPIMREEEVGAYKNEGGRKVALITEEIGNMTGGRYYAWFMAIALVELGYDVTVYTTARPAYFDYFSEYKLPKLVIIEDKRDIKNLDIQADLYIGVPLVGNIAVTKMRAKYKKPSYCMIFDPLPMMQKLNGAPYSGWEESIEKLVPSDVKILTLCKSTVEYIHSWLNKVDEDIIPIYPCINSRELKKVPEFEREDYVVFVSRLVGYKGFEHVVKACKSLNINLKVVSSVLSASATRVVRELNYKGRVEFFIGYPDVDKFELIARSKAIVNASSFEGFGLWGAEAVATGTPLVCYDLPTIREIGEFAKVDNFYLAEQQNIEDLTAKLKTALEEKRFHERSSLFDFESLVENVKKVFYKEPKIGVVTIALNEQEFIGASLRSVIKHKNITKVAVVEGAVKLFAHASNEQGLSLDDTSGEVLKVMGEQNGNKIAFDRFGWAVDKSQLRNKALSMLGDVDYVLVVDADEVWKSEDIDKLIDAMQGNPSIIKFRFNHFWKVPTLVARGSNWESMLFRCFRFGEGIHWKDHEKEVVDKKEIPVSQLGETVIIDEPLVYHYGYMKKAENVQNKIEYYRKRDTNLDVKDTFTNWKQGDNTSTTHGGGEAVEFLGEHPSEILGIIK